MVIKIDVVIHSASMDEIRKALAHLQTLGERTMTAISDFAAKQQQFNARMDAAVDGLTKDVADLNAKILELQQTPGAITPEDQALLDSLEERGNAIAAKLEALDGLTPPAPPVG
jgi:uncharacterized coiled-coil protein SlyX